MKASQLIQNEVAKISRHLILRTALVTFLGILVIVFGERFFRPSHIGSTQFVLPGAWPFIVNALGPLPLFLATTVGILLVSSEFSVGTAKLCIIAGMTKREFLLGKLAAFLGISFAFLLLQVLVGTSLALIGFQIGTQPVLRQQDLLLLLGSLVAMVGHAAMGFSVSTLFRAPGPALAVYFFYVLGVESLLRTLLSARWGLGEVLASLLPGSVFEQLRNPGCFEPNLVGGAESCGFRLSVSETAGETRILALFAFGVAWVVLFVLASYKTQVRRDF